MSPKIMDGNGVIKNTADRNIYGKNKVGCPIKLNVISTLDGIEPYNGHTDYFEKERVFFYDSKGEPWTLTSTNLMAEKMDTSDVTNDPKTGYTDEEKSKWNGYKPVVGMNYKIQIILGEVSSAYYKTKITDKKKIEDLFYYVIRFSRSPSTFKSFFQ